MKIAYVDWSNLCLAGAGRNARCRINADELKAWLGARCDEVHVFISSPQRSRFHRQLERLGFRVHLSWRPLGGGEKEVDTNLCVRMTRHLYRRKMGSRDTVVLVSADRDMAPGVREARGLGVRVVVLASEPSQTLRQLADHVEAVPEFVRAD